MKILCVADYTDPLVYSINAKERFKDIDLVLGAGDVTMNYLDFIASTLNKEVCFVFGNHNLKHFAQFKKSKAIDLFTHNSDENAVPHNFGTTYIGDKVCSIHGLLIAGLGGSIQYNKGENQYTEMQMTVKILKLIPRLLINRLIHKRFIDILLTHSPPQDLNDRSDIPHRGFKSFRYFIKYFKPKYHLHGHIHLIDLNENRHIQFCDTEIINVYGHYILEFGVDNA